MMATRTALNILTMAFRFLLHKQTRLLVMLFRVLVTTSLVILPTQSYAEQAQTLGQWDIHYIVLNSTFLQPDIARQYGVQRSKYNAFVNISVLDKDSKKAQDVDVRGIATNLLGNSKELSFKKVQEQQAIYYLAQLSFRNRETFRFEVTVRHGNEQQILKFKQELVTDD